MDAPAARGLRRADVGGRVAHEDALLRPRPKSLQRQQHALRVRLVVGHALEPDAHGEELARTHFGKLLGGAEWFAIHLKNPALLRNDPKLQPSPVQILKKLPDSRKQRDHTGGFGPIGTAIRLKEVQRR